MTDFIFAADLHLDQYTWSVNRQICGDSLASLELLLMLAQTRGCPLALGGDVFDTKRISSDLAKRVSVLLNKYKVPVYYIQGNHDLNDIPWLDVLCPEYAKRLSRDPCCLGNATVCGIDWQLLNKFPDALKDPYPLCDVLVVHQTFDCFCNNASAVASSLVRPFNLVLSGDYHVPGTYIEGDNTVIVSPGSTNRRSVSEPTPSVLLVNNAKERDVSFCFLPHRRMVTIDIEATEQQALHELTVQDMAPCIDCGGPVPEIIQVPLLVLRGRITSKLRDTWLSSALAEKVFMLFSPSVTKDEGEAILSEQHTTTVRGSNQYISDVLMSYPTSEKIRLMTASYLFGDGDSFLEDVRRKFEGDNVQ